MFINKLNCVYFFSSGHYMYIEASSPRRRGDAAQLLSPSYSLSRGGCLNFWYNMNGASMGTLNVILRQGTRPQRIWTKTGNQGIAWQLAQVTIPQSSNYTLMFEGIVGTGYQSDMAIDDISIISGGCTLPGQI